MAVIYLPERLFQVKVFVDSVKIWGTYDDGFHLAYGAMANAGRNQDSS